MKCAAHDLEIVGSNPGRVELGMGSTSKSYWNQEKFIARIIDSWYGFRTNIYNINHHYF